MSVSNVTRKPIVEQLRDGARSLQDLQPSGTDGARRESIYDFVLEHGRPYTGQPLPSHFRRGGFKHFQESDFLSSLFQVIGRLQTGKPGPHNNNPLSDGNTPGEDVRGVRSRSSGFERRSEGGCGRAAERLITPNWSEYPPWAPR